MTNYIFNSQISRPNLLNRDEVTVVSGDIKICHEAGTIEDPRCLEINNGSLRNLAYLNMPHKAQTSQLLAEGSASKLEIQRQIKQEDPVVRCPSCHTRFYVDADILSRYQQSGRKPQFHCSKCDHVFTSSITAHTAELTTDDINRWKPSSDVDSSDSNGETSVGTVDSAESDMGIMNDQVKGDGFFQVSSMEFEPTSWMGSGAISSNSSIGTCEHNGGDESQQACIGEFVTDRLDGRSASKVLSTSSPQSIADHAVKSAIGSDDDQPLVTHFADEVKPQDTPWEVKRSTSEGSLQRSASAILNRSTQNPGVEKNQDTGPYLEIPDTFHGSTEIQGPQLGSTFSKKSGGSGSKSRKASGKKGLYDGLSIWKIARKALSTGGSKKRFPNPTSPSHPYLTSSHRRPNSAPIEIAGPDSDQIPLSLKPSKPSAWNLLSSMISRGPRERWVGTVLLGAPLVLTILTLAVFSYFIRFSIPAYEFMVFSLGLKGSEIAPVGLTVHETAFKSVALESGETVYTISGKVVNSTDRDFREITVEGLTFNSQGQMTSRGTATLGNALNIAKLKALPLEDIMSLQQKKRDTSSVLKPGQSDKFIIALSDRQLLGETSLNLRGGSATNAQSLAEEHSSGSNLASTEYLSARVYLVK